MAVMGNVLLFDDEGDDSPVNNVQELVVSEATPKPLRGFLAVHDPIDGEGLRQDLLSAQIELSDTFEPQCEFALVELSSRQASNDFVWPTHLPAGPVIYFGGRDRCLQAYEKGGFDFVLQSPLLAEELPVRIRHAVDGFRQFQDLNQRARNSQTIAMQAMTINAELGNILHCLEHCFNCADIVELSRECFACLRDMGLSACMTFFQHRRVSFYSDDRRFRPIEQQVIMQTRGKQRIVEHAANSLYHYDHISVLIRDMPIHDMERYGVLRDHICLLLNGVQARAAAIEAQVVAEARATRSAATARVIQDIIVDMDAQKRRFTNRSSDLLETLLLDLRTEFSELSLNELEEKKLNQLVESTSAKMAALFKETEDADKTFCDILGNLATTLRR
jgi:hypothetical protein